MKSILFRKKTILKSIFAVITVSALIFSPFSSLVFADDNNLSIEIVSVKQGDNEITLGKECEDCSLVGQTQDYEHPLNVRWKFSGLKTGEKYTYHIESGSALEFVADSSEKIFDKEYSLNMYSGETYFGADVNLKDNYDISAYNSASVKIVNPNFEKLVINILRVKQHGQEKQKHDIDCEYCSNSYGFDVNKYENVTIEAEAVSALDDYTYTFSMTAANEKPVSMTGAELKNGFSAIVTPDVMDITWSDVLDFGIFYDAGNTKNLLYRGEGQPWYSYGLVLTEDDTVGRFVIDNARLKQEQTNILVDEGYIAVRAGLYDKDTNPVVIRIKGDKYIDDQEYTVTVERTRTEGFNHVAVGSNNYTLTGAEINAGKEISLDGLDLKFMDHDEYMFDDGMYYVKVQIGDIYKVCGIEYGYGILKSTVLWEDGRQNAPGTKGAGVFQSGISHFGMQGYMANVGVDQNAYIYYAAENFDEDKTYNYALYYGNEIEYYNNLDALVDKDVLYSGNITGKELNAGKLGFKIKNPNNYNRVSYVLVLSEGDKIMTTVGDYLDLWSGVGLISQDINISQNAYLQMSNFWYQIPTGADMDVIFKGTGFNNDKKYSISIKKLVNGEFVESIAEQQYYGSELNNGDAKISIKYNGQKDEQVAFGVFVSDDKGNTNDYVGSWLEIKYVDLNTLLRSNSGYRIDNTRNALRDISKNTTSDAVTSNFSVGNGSAKVFDKTGENEINGKVGTGMIVRVFDEYSRPLNDIGIAVKGDTSGDGEVNVLDLVKTSRHLAEIEELDGLYSVAGDVTNTGSVGLLDLVKAARDVAEIEEL